MKKACLFTLTFILSFTFFTGCQKELSYDGGAGVVIVPPPPRDSTITYPVDDATQVTASVNGVVLDENNKPFAGATVRCGSQSLVTNSMGIFFFKNISVSKNNGSVSVSKTGYFKGTRNFLAVAGKSHFIRIQLIKESLTATIPAANGGTVDLGNGASIIFPAGAFAYPNGAVYSGNVQVYAKYIDPKSPALHETVPGDLRGLRKNGLETVLNTYGIIGADLFDAGGQPLVIATGKKAGIEFPIPATVLPAAGDSIILWHFDDARARWLEEGIARKSGGKIKADVSMFSFWSINEPAGFVRMSCVIMNAADTTPVGNQFVKLTVAGTSMSCYGYTACTGFVMSGVPVGQPIVMDIEVSNACGTSLHTRNIGPFTTSTSLDTIWITAPATTYTLFTGYIKNCQGGVASNSYISLYSPSSGSYIFEPDANGYFTLPVYTCVNTTLDYSYQVTEFGTGNQSPVVTGSTTAHTVNLGNVYACATPPPAPTADVYVFGDEQSSGPNEIIKYWKNGVATNVTDGSSSCYAHHAFMTATNDKYIAGVEWDAAGFTSNAKLWVNGVKTDLSGLSFLNSSATGVFVNGPDVYVSYDMDDITTGLNVARLWKNGTSTTLPGSGANFHASCVYVSGSDVYVGGYRTPSASTVSRAVIWKNGVAQYLNNGAFNSSVRKILVNGTDVYAVGQDNLGANGTGRAVIWKNGVATYLTDGLTSDAMANDIFIDGTDIYVCGRKSSGAGEKAQVWKNGAATVLSASGSNGIAQGVYVKNSDVYVSEAGFINGPVRLWKNNIPTLLTNGSNFNSVSSVIVR